MLSTRLKKLETQFMLFINYETIVYDVYYHEN